MVVFTCFEPILPPEMVVNIIGDEYMSILIFLFFFVLGIFGHFRAFWFFLGILGVSVEIWGILGVLVSYKITRGVRLIVAVSLKGFRGVLGVFGGSQGG